MQELFEGRYFGTVVAELPPQWRIAAAPHRPTCDTAEARVGLRISDAAAAAGPTPRALRFYEETGPLPDPAHGHRQYGPDEIVARVRVIRERLGLSLTVEALRERGHLPRSGRRSGQHRRRPLTCGADGPWQIFPPVYRNPRSATYTAMRQVAQHFRNTTIPTG